MTNVIDIIEIMEDVNMKNIYNVIRKEIFVRFI